MKKVNAILLALPFVLLGLSAFAQPGTTTPAKTVGSAMLTVDHTEHDFGTIKKGSDGNCTFVISNTGDQPLIISHCQGSCGCTTPKCETNPIAPGEKSEITVHYDTTRMGPFTKSVTVNWNSPDGAPTMLTIKGEVVE